VIAQVVLGAGLALLFLGGAGLVRLHDPYERLQGAGVGDIGGATLVIVGLVLARGWGATGGVVLVLLFFLLFTGPIATHAVAKAAFVRGVRPKEKGS